MYQVLAQKKVKVAKHENFEEALMKWIRQSNAKDGIASDKITEDRIKVIFLVLYIVLY